MRKHPGIWFTIISLTITFFLPYILSFVNWHPKIESSIIIAWGGIVVYGMTVFHIKWLEKLDRMQIEKDRKNGNCIQ